MAVVKLKDADKIIKELGIEQGGQAHAFFTNTCKNHMEKYVPKGDTGNLRDITHEEVDSITYKMPYAHAQYVGIVNGHRVKNYTTPGTGSYWDKRMMSAERQDVVKEVAEYIKRGNK